MTDEDTRAEAEAILYTIARLFAHRGQAKEVALLADAEPVLKQTGYDSWDDGTYFYTLFLNVALPAYVQIQPECAEIEIRIAEEVKSLFRIDSPCDRLRAVKISPKLTNAEPDWREKAKAWAQGSGMTNQGRVRSDNIAAKEKDGLLFRSQPEINLYMALKGQGISFAPLPVFIRGGKTHQRMEPDFIVIKNGITMQIEVDGDTVHTETPAEAQTRVAMLEDEGVIVHRLAASKCDSLEKAQVSAKEILEKITARKNLK